MAEIMGTGTDDELRRQQEAERAAREEQKRQEEQARQAEEQAKQAEADAKHAEEEAKAVQEAAAASAPEAPEIPDVNAQFQADVDAQWANTKKKRGEQHFYTIEQQMAYEQENAVTPRAMRADEGWAEYTVDYSSIKTKDDLSLFMAGTEDDSQIVKAGYAWAKQNGQDPEEVLAYAEYYIYDQYGRELFKNPYSNGAKIRRANGVLNGVGLLNLDGEALDMDSASPSQIVSSIRMEADKKKHDAAVDAVMAMCGIPGSPFYGMSISKDDLAFLDSADMTQKEFSGITDGFKGMFALADEPTEENAAAYEIAVRDIDSMDKPLRVKKQLYANLADAYAERTGFVAPSAEDILTAREQRMADEAGDPAEQGGGFLGWVKGLFTSEKAEKGESATGDGKTPEALLAELKAQEKGTGYGGGSAPAASATASSYAAAGSAPDKAESAVPGAVAPSPLAVPSGMEGREMQGPVQQESGAKPVYRRDIAYDPNMTDAQALAYYRNGATLDAANMQQIAWAVDDPDVVDLMVGDYGADAQNAYAARGIGVAAPAQGGGYAAASGASAPKFDVMHAYRKFGSSIGNAAHMLSSGAMDVEMASEGYLALASVVREAKGLIENPENGIVIPKGVNQYDHVLSLYPDLANRVQGVLDAQKGVNDAYTQNALRAKEERQATLDSYTTQIQAGKGTPEMAAAVAAAYGGDYADIEDDETRAVFRFNLSERSGYFRDDGAFWQGDSAAAQEGQRLRQMGRGYGEYKADLKAETERLIDEYATAAHKMGLPLEQFLAGAGIDGVGQMIDIAYNAMQADGNAYRDDVQAQEAMEVLETTSVGKLGAAGYGALHGVVDTTAGYAQTLYMALDETDYRAAVANLTEEYTTKYGPSAPQMYFSDVMAYANSGALSEEATAELLDKASRAANIFDLGFEIDAGPIEGPVRLTYNALQKVNEQLEGVIARMPEDERRIATMAGSFVGSIEEGAVALTVGKAAGVLGAGAKAANLIGSAVGFGAPSFSATYDEGRQMGMSPGMAGRRAFVRAGITSALNMGGNGTQMDIWFGETGYRGMLDALRSGGKEVAKTMGRAVLRSAHQEGKEELEELAAEKVFDLMDDELLAIDRGAKPSISRMMSSMTTGLMQTDVRALAAEAVESYGMGAAFGSIFTLGGLAKTARSAKRGLNKLTQYESVGLADRMVTGDAAFTEENMGKVFAALQKDLEDPKFRRWLDSADMAARDQNATVTAMLLGTGEAERNAAVDAAGKAAEYGEKAKAAKTASDVAKDHFFEIGARVERGEAKGSEMDAALAQMQKADTALTEAQNAADKAAELAAQKASEWLRACRAQGVAIRAADMQRRATVMAEMRTARAKQEAEQVQARETGNVLTMEKENFISERYPDADEETRETILSTEAWNAEQPEMDTESENQAIRNAAAFAGQISRRFGVAIEFRDGLEGGALGKYEDGRIILDKRSATQGEVIRRTAVHELTHRAESSAWYGELRDTLLDMGYGGDADRLAADVQAKMRTYNDHAEATGSGKRYTSEEIEREIVADLAGELFTADEKATARLVEEKPGLMRRVYEVIRDVVNRLRGVRDPEADKLRRAEKLMRKALDTAEGTHEAGRYAIELDESNWPIVKADRDFVLSDNPKEWGKDINEYIRDEIRQKGEMRIKTLDGDEIILDAKSQRKAKDWLTNGDENDNRVRKNASAHLDEVVAVSEDVAPGKPNEPDDKGKHGWSRDGWRYREAIFEDYNKKRYLLNLSVGVENGNKTVYNIGKVEEIKKKDHTSVSGQLGRVPSSPAKTNDRPASPRLDPSDTIVAESAPFGNSKYSLPDGNILMQEIEAYRALGRKAGTEAPKQQTGTKNTGERQFATKTAQQSEAMPQWLKSDLMADPTQRTYERDSNDAQLMRAWTRYQQEGYEGVKERLLNTKDFSADDIADANMMMAMAFRNDDVATALEIAHKYNTEGTKEGQTLQARKLFQRMTPTGIKAWAGGQAETALSAYIATHSRMKRDVDAAAARVEESIRDKQSGDEVLRLNAAGTFTIDSRNNRWGIPINEQQQALIDHYNLGNVPRPGLFYNRATRKQRMLEAIIATPNPLELTGGGLNLIQRLEYMQEGVAVITNADLDYMGMQLAQYAAMDADSQQEREGDLALSRAYEAYGNIDPASMDEKARTWRYTSMLLSIPSAARNVIGNAAQNAVNETAHALAVELDRRVSRKTGKHTMAHLSAAEQAEGFRAFAEETVNTFKDFYIDKTVTANMHGDDRFNTSRRGRVYENQMLEAARLAESFLMSVGDRNFWKRAYVNSIAEQQRVAAQNKTALDMETAAEIAREEANYATFNEDNSVRRLFGELKNNDNFLIRTAADLILPFTGVPTNITRRMVTYSPAGLIGTVVRGLWDVATKTDIDQKRFITDLSRGLTGTALFGVGMALREAGMILLGTGDEDDSRVYGVRAAQGAQYTPYIRIGDRYMSLNMFAPAVSAMTMGAAAMDLFKGDEDAMTALYNASLAGIDQIFDASYLSSLQSIFTGQGTAAERIGAAVFDSAVSQNVPAVLGQLATAIDPYVRDTKDKNAIMQALKTGLIAKIPGLREMLPEKVDVTGKSVVSKEGLRNFFDPTYTTAAADDPALDEMMRLYEATQDSSFMPLDVLSGKKNTLTVDGTKYTLTGKQKEAYKKRYGELWHDEVSKLVSSPAYQRMSDEKKAERIRKIVKAARTKANRETALKLGQ